MDMTYFLTNIHHHLNKNLYVAVKLPHTSFVLKANAMAAVP